jgi:hypothetical protein
MTWKRDKDHAIELLTRYEIKFDDSYMEIEVNSGEVALSGYVEIVVGSLELTIYLDSDEIELFDYSLLNNPSVDKTKIGEIWNPYVTKLINIEKLKNKL